MELDRVELAIEIEEEFDISIPDSAASRVVTAGDLRDCVMAQLAQRGRAADRAEVWLQVRDIIAEQGGIDAHLIYPEARLIEDLCLD